MASEDARTPKCELEGDGCVRLSSILQAFGAPIREEQAWAVCYQTSKCMCKEWTTDNRGCYCLTDTSQLRIHKDGSVDSSTVRDLGPGRGQDHLSGTRDIPAGSVFGHVAHKRYQKVEIGPYQSPIRIVRRFPRGLDLIFSYRGSKISGKQL
ncbi:conserved hypothetical protein [Ixodes scapularis]|uniref:KIND domain-containing protein n=1 Tax=Ixodes scapularis TaxID=6945 RepID=B7PMJ8_IXOSC|nr:conserved hypothetical protein [Ixodes scapularis]|eukprot:XP_002434996.1 conserved hypothetical protein [Ixodes scapularis]